LTLKYAVRRLAAAAQASDDGSSIETEEIAAKLPMEILATVKDGHIISYCFP